MSVLHLRRHRLSITEDECRDEEIAKEVMAQRSVQPHAAARADRESSVPRAQHFRFPRLADQTSVDKSDTTMDQISLPEAESIVADLGALHERRFRLIAPGSVLEEDDTVDDIDPNSWRISGLDFDTSTYNVVFGGITDDPIQVGKDELLRLLTASQLVQM